MASQPTPNVTGTDVERVVRRDFPEERIPEVLAMHAEYGRENWHREPDRVRLAVLKLAAGSVERLRTEIESAKCDYRDVLAYAEYARYMKGVPPSEDFPDEKRQQIIDADWKEYQDWLTR
jgi:hypothetical protein